jgi:hypothetical protein
MNELDGRGAVAIRHRQHATCKRRAIIGVASSAAALHMCGGAVTVDRALERRETHGPGPIEERAVLRRNVEA